ncbi:MULTISPECIES: hypothetical protein [Halomicrobium]|uniref:Uncharacterized protein n=2 Tax=Halomicrobium mukohataei TaxID=57705 RepID=C7P1C4_HALMD|nr:MULTISPECIES: hypothetical protein [Halomicrobium]ACV47132.1 hypothetical protein Hmuk_1004 [Halomicrobium mukohataei DSM 12286]QCD65614.1 hypothetical protein E5139_08180 [Halomicrobium mukohataei]QFR20420.1 hypothetical protein GBQ70_08175 [Halomicrobium sp. ZPS1]
MIVSALTTLTFLLGCVALVAIIWYFTSYILNREDDSLEGIGIMLLVLAYSLTNQAYQQVVTVDDTTMGVLDFVGVACLVVGVGVLVRLRWRRSSA